MRVPVRLPGVDRGEIDLDGQPTLIQVIADLQAGIEPVEPAPVGAKHHGSKLLRHPDLALLRLHVEVLALADDHDLRLVTWLVDQDEGPAQASAGAAPGRPR